MAKNPNNEELRQQALRALAQGRAEISAEVYHLRQQLSPSRVMHRAVDRHTSLVVFVAFAAGTIPALFLFRGKQSPGRERDRLRGSVTKAPRKPLLTSVLTGALGILAKTIGPSLIKSVLLPRTLDAFSRSRPGATRNGRPASR